MARYIFIDNSSGYIWGDSADLDGRIHEGTALEFAAQLDHSIDPSAAANRTYEWASRAEFSNETGYHVYRADVNGSDAVPIARDGQDREMIRAVQDSCEYEGFIRVLEGEDV